MPAAVLQMEAGVAAAVAEHGRGGAVGERGRLAARERAGHDVRVDAHRGRREDVEPAGASGEDAPSRLRVEFAEYERDGSAFDAAARGRHAPHLGRREPLHEDVHAHRGGTQTNGDEPRVGTGVQRILGRPTRILGIEPEAEK